MYVYIRIIPSKWQGMRELMRVEALIGNLRGADSHFLRWER